MANTMRLFIVFPVVAVLFISTALAIPAMPRDGLDFDPEDPTSLLRGPPASCLDHSSSGEIPASCYWWRSSIERHNLQTNMTTIFEADPTRYPHYAPPSLDLDDDTEDMVALTNTTATATTASTPSLARRHMKISISPNDRLYCPRCNEAKRISCCVFSWTIIATYCCVQQQAYCCHDPRCVCTCKGRKECVKEGLGWCSKIDGIPNRDLDLKNMPSSEEMKNGKPCKGVAGSKWT